MTSSTGRHPDKPAQRAPQRGPRSRLTIALLAALAAVIAGTIYISIRPPWEDRPRPPGEPGPSQAQRIRLAMEDLIRRGDSTPANASRAELLARRAAYEQARNLGRQFIHLSDPRDIQVRPLLARAEIRLGNLEEAERTVTALLNLAPGSPEGLSLMAEIVAARGGDGLDYLRKAAQSPQAGPEIWARCGVELLRRGLREEAATYLSRAEKAGHADGPTLLGLAVLAMDRNDYAKAEPILQRLIRSGSLARAGGPDPGLLLMLADAQVESGKATEAEATLRAALQRADDPVLKMRLAGVLWLRGQRPQAADLYAQLAEDPHLEALAAFKAARCYYLLDRHALAMKYIDRAAAHAETPEVVEWRRKIEDARFGPPAGQATPFRLTPPRPATTQEAPEPRPATPGIPPIPPRPATRPAWLRP